MYFRKWLRENVTDVHREKAAKILLAILIAVFSVLILASEVPESNYVQETLESLEESKTTVMQCLYVSTHNAHLGSTEKTE